MEQKSTKNPIIIFRFHKYLDVCMNRLEMLKFYNPGIPIYGIFGGEKDKCNFYKKNLNKFLCDVYDISDKSFSRRWKDFDFSLQEWYINFGKDIDFDRAFVSEWDLLVFAPFENIYSNLNENDIAVTALVPISEIKDIWFWTSNDLLKTEWENLIKYARESFGYSLEPFGSQGPGLTFPKDFLEEYSKISGIPDGCNDEIRIPLFAQILGFPLKDTGFYKGWFDPYGKFLFNCERNEINEFIIRNELKLNKQIAFHPFNKIFYAY